jgi:hypothetical protein
MRNIDTTRISYYAREHALEMINDDYFSEEDCMMRLVEEIVDQYSEIVSADDNTYLHAIIDFTSLTLLVNFAISEAGYEAYWLKKSLVAYVNMSQRLAFSDGYTKVVSS